MIRALALLPYPRDRVPSQRYRIEQWLPRLAGLGVDLEILSFETPTLHRLMTTPGHAIEKAFALSLRALGHARSVAQAIDEFDVVFLHREAIIFGPAWLERAVAWKKPIVFDFDDAIWLPSPNPVNPLAPWFKFHGKTRSIVRGARAVTVGNAYLARWASPLNQRVHVVPPTIETEGAYARVKTHEPKSRPVIGWSGTYTTLRYLEELRPMFEKFARRRDFTLRVLTNGPKEHWPGIEVDWRPWSSDREVEDLLEIDIGLMPQPDEEWVKGKCGMKALQYMALGIPAVVAGTGMLPELVSSGENGFVASTPEEWMAHLDELLLDADLRGRLGAHARQTIAERYSAKVHAPRVADILRAAAAG